MVPQAPQLLLLVFVSIQEPLQLVCPEPQLLSHLPEAQTSEAAHALAQVPQFFVSDRRLTQVPEQSVKSLGQLATHVPALQTCPPAHALAQAPQWSESVWMLAHTSVHSVRPEEQLSRHLPPLQTYPDGQASSQRFASSSQPPQISGSNSMAKTGPSLIPGFNTYMDSFLLGKLNIAKTGSAYGRTCQTKRSALPSEARLALPKVWAPEKWPVTWAPPPAPTVIPRPAPW